MAKSVEPLKSEKYSISRYDSDLGVLDPVVVNIDVSASMTDEFKSGLALLSGVKNGIDLSHARLSMVELNDAELNGAQLKSVDFFNGKLNNAQLNGAYLPRAELSCAEMEGASLRGANLFDADLSCAKLISADLSGAHLCDTNFYCANLTNAKLVGAVLSGADFSDADLTGSDLRGADLRGADLTNTIMIGANLDGAMLDGKTFNKINEKNLAIAGDIVSHLIVVEDSEPYKVLQRATDLAAQSLVKGYPQLGLQNNGSTTTLEDYQSDSPDNPWSKALQTSVARYFQNTMQEDGGLANIDEIKGARQIAFDTIIQVEAHQLSKSVELGFKRLDVNERLKSDFIDVLENPGRLRDLKTTASGEYHNLGIGAQMNINRVFKDRGDERYPAVTMALSDAMMGKNTGVSKLNLESELLSDLKASAAVRGASSKSIKIHSEEAASRAYAQHALHGAGI